MRALIALGSNLGDRRASLDRATALLAEADGVYLLARSGWRETRPAGGPKGQPPFLNGAVLIETSCTPEQLFHTLTAIEHGLGRRRGQRWEPRTIDLDLLLYDQEVITSQHLIVPHPRMAWRRFVIEPAVEIAPDMRHPLLGRSMARLLEHLNTSPAYVAITGPPGADTRGVALAVADAVGGEPILDEPRTGLEIRWLAEAGAPDASGTFYPAAVQSLGRHTRLLAKDQAGWSRRGPYRISDFWFGQTLVLAGLSFGNQKLASFESAFKEASRQVAWPRLTVLLAPSVCLGDGRPAPRNKGVRPRRCGRAEASWEDKVAEALVARIFDLDRGPVLCPQAARGPEAMAEIVAAIEAMDA